MINISETWAPDWLLLAVAAFCLGMAAALIWYERKRRL